MCNALAQRGLGLLRHRRLGSVRKNPTAPLSDPRMREPAEISPALSPRRPILCLRVPDRPSIAKSLAAPAAVHFLTAKASSPSNIFCCAKAAVFSGGGSLHYRRRRCFSKPANNPKEVQHEFSKGTTAFGKGPVPDFMIPPLASNSSSRLMSSRDCSMVPLTDLLNEIFPLNADRIQASFFGLWVFHAGRTIS
jgi:hypothetical protein